MPRTKSASGDGAPAPTDDRVELKRVRAGTYRTLDGRFNVEQESGRWLVLDTEQTDELGLPLVRGPFATLDDARDGIMAARAAPVPRSPLEERLKEAARRPGHAAAERATRERPARTDRAEQGPPSHREHGDEPAPAPSPPAPPTIVAHRVRPVEAHLLRAALETDLGRGAIEVGLELGASGRASAGQRANERDTNAEGGDPRRYLGGAGTHAVVAYEEEHVVGLLIAAELPSLAEPHVRLIVERLRIQDERRDEIASELLDTLIAAGNGTDRRNDRRAVFVIDAKDEAALAALRKLTSRRSATDRALVEISIRTG